MLEEPLLFNSFLTTQMLQPASLRTSLGIGPSVNSGLMEERPVSLRYPSLRLWGTEKREDRSCLFPPQDWTLFRPLGNKLKFLCQVKFFNPVSLMGYKESRWTEFYDLDVS